MRSPVISLSSQQLCPPFVGVGYNPWSMFRFLVLFPLLPVVGLDYGLSCLNQFCVGICQSLETVCFGTKVTFKKKFGFLCVCVYVCVCLPASLPSFARVYILLSLYLPFCFCMTYPKWALVGSGTDLPLCENLRRFKTFPWFL